MPQVRGPRNRSLLALPPISLTATNPTGKAPASRKPTQVPNLRGEHLVNPHPLIPGDFADRGLCVHGAQCQQNLLDFLIAGVGCVWILLLAHAPMLPLARP